MSAESHISVAAGAATGHPSMRLAAFKNSADRLKAVLQTFRYPGRQLLVVPASAGSLPGESHTRDCVQRDEYTLDGTDMLNAIPERRDCVQPNKYILDGNDMLNAVC